MSKIKLIRIEAYYIDYDNDFDNLDEVKAVLENVRYPNHCLDSIDVVDVKSTEIDFDDDHELNNYSVTKEMYRKYFKRAEHE